MGKGDVAKKSPYFGLFKVFSRNEPSHFSSNLALLSCVSLYDATYKEVVPYALVRLASTVAVVVPRRSSHTGVLATLLHKSRHLTWRYSD
jgi:hypothetical protein